MEQMCEDRPYILEAIQKEELIRQLRKKGCRITKQREALLDVMLQKECSCCKEIYYLASKKMPQIGMATIYRMLNSLEEIGAVKRKNMYYLNDDTKELNNGCKVALDNGSVIELDDEVMRQVLQKGLQVCGYIQNETILELMSK